MKKQPTMPISEFKAKCLATLERVRRTGQPLLITRFGKPIAQVVPPPVEAGRADWVGALSGTAELADDLVAPVSSEADWESASS